ncbi:MAG: hypothetical protein SNJ82_10110 [Gemmataceae bacterium]
MWGFRWWAWDSKPLCPRQALQRDLQLLRSTCFHLLAMQGKPRGLRWVSLDWHDDWVVVRESATNRWLALCPITVHFEAIEGSDMEGVEAVGLPRLATAVFVYDRGRWQASQTVWFNLSPEEVIARAAGRYVRI